MLPQEALYLIYAIIHPDPSVASGATLLPFAHPDGAQIVLLSWGRGVSWVWAVWNDPRFADIELITQLVSLFQTQNLIINNDYGLDSCLDMSR